MNNPDRLQEVKVFKCPSCAGTGRFYDERIGGSPYQPIKFSRERMREVMAAWRECSRCNGRGVVYEEVR